MYENWEELSFIHSYDFLDFTGIKNVKSKWGFGKKTIEIEYMTKYAEEKGKTLFGPYFFKFELPKVSKFKEGVLRIEIELEKFHLKGIPKGHRKMRQERFVEYFQEKISLSQ